MIAPQPTVRPAPARLSRARCTGWQFVFMLTWPVATVLFCVWVTVAALSLVTIAVPVLLAVTGPIRRYVDAHRRWASRVLDEPIPAPYRTADGSLFARVRSTLADRATWRDALWLLVHSTAGATLAITSVALLAATLFYASYPFLYAITPSRVFDEPFGGWWTLHSVGQSFVMTPLALVCLGLWFVSLRPFTRAQARMARALLR